MKKKKSYFICPHCGTTVSSDAPCCPGCGSDEETGWSGESEYTPFSGYDDENESDARPAKQRSRIKYIGAGIAVLLICLLLPISFSWGIYLVPFIILGYCVSIYIAHIYSKQPKRMERVFKKKLLQLLHGDRKQMERLLMYEQMRSPDSTKLQQLDNAIFRLLRDRR